MKKKKINNKTKKKGSAEEMFGKFPHWKSKKSTQELKDEMRRGWD